MTAVETGRTGTSGRLADLMHVGGYEFTGPKRAVSERFTRLTTVVTLRGARHREVGEGTTYAPPDQLAFRSAGAVLPLVGEWSLDTFSAAREQMELFHLGPSAADFHNFWRWAFKSDALDMAIRPGRA
jgi:hypothetical protein